MKSVGNKKALFKYSGSHPCLCVRITWGHFKTQITPCTRWNRILLMGPSHQWLNVHPNLWIANLKDCQMAERLTLSSYVTQKTARFWKYQLHRELLRLNIKSTFELIFLKTLQEEETSISYCSERGWVLWRKILLWQVGGGSELDNF